MLLVKTVVKRSTIAGLGLFAEEEIKKGQIIWRYDPKTSFLISQPQFKALSESYQFSETMLYYLTYGFYVAKMDGLLVCLDNARYVNHSLDPNSGTLSATDQHWQFSIANRDIKKGEEITENYELYDNCEWVTKLLQEHNIFIPEAQPQEVSV